MGLLVNIYKINICENILTKQLPFSLSSAITGETCLLEPEIKIGHMHKINMYVERVMLGED